MKPTRCTLLLSIFISTSLHVSGNYVPIIRRTCCTYATLVFFTLCGWLSGLFRATVCPSSGELAVSMRHWYFSPCVGGCLVCLGQLCAHHQENLLYLCDNLCVWLSGIQPPIQSEKYQCRTDTESSPDDGHIYT